MFTTSIAQNGLPPYEQSYSISDFSNDPSGNLFYLKVSYNVMTFKGSSGIDTGYQLSSFASLPINSPYTFPDVDLGRFKDYSGADTCYTLRIDNGYLILQCDNNGITNPGYVTFNFEIDLTPDDLNDNIPNTANPSVSENYVYTLEAFEGAHVGNLYQIPNQSGSAYQLKQGVNQRIIYFDGLGRQKQGIGIQASPNRKDIITHFEYDNSGRQALEFLSYPSTNHEDGSFEVSASSETNQYYLNNYAADLMNGVNPYSEKSFEESPLNRIVKQGAPGSDWKVINGGNDHTIKMEYEINSLDIYNADFDNVYAFEVNFPNSNNTEITQLVSGGYIQENELSKHITKDESWQSGQQYEKDHTAVEFKNKKGQVVLKRTYNENEPHDTYYVYDDYENLTYVIPPKASNTIVEQTPSNQH